MPTPRQRQFFLAQIGWMLAAIATLASLGALTVEYVFVVSFVGLVVVTALTEPPYATVSWRRRLRLPLVVGGLVFLGLVGIRTVEKFLAGF